MTVLRHACASVSGEAACGHAGPAKHAVVEMGLSPTGLPAVVTRRVETWVKGVCPCTPAARPFLEDIFKQRLARVHCANSQNASPAMSMGEGAM